MRTPTTRSCCAPRHAAHAGQPALEHRRRRALPAHRAPSAGGGAARRLRDVHRAGARVAEPVAGGAHVVNRLSGLDASFLYMEKANANSHMHVAFTIITDPSTVEDGYSF